MTHRIFKLSLAAALAFATVAPSMPVIAMPVASAPLPASMIEVVEDGATPVLMQARRARVRPARRVRPIARPGAVRPGAAVRPVRRPVVIVRPWRPRPHYGRIIAGVALGTIIVAAVAGSVPAQPAPNVCWYWADPAYTQGYWDYCQ
jgi:hypothetical protein